MSVDGQEIRPRYFLDGSIDARYYGLRGNWNEVSRTGQDDTAALQLALDEGAQQQRPVKLLPGMYKVAQLPGRPHAVELKTNMSLIGVGKPTIRISDDFWTPGTDLYNCFCAYGGEHNILIEGIVFKGNNTPFDRAASFNGANSAVMFRGHPEAGGLLANYNCTVRNCEFMDMWGFSGHGLNENNYDIVWENNTQQRMGNGLNLNSMGRITGNLLEDCQGIEHASEQILISNNRFRRCSNNGISVAGTGNQLHGMVISGNVIESVVPSDGGHVGIGIIVGSGSQDVLITDNQIEGADYQGLLIHNAGLTDPPWPRPDGIVVDGLIIHDCSNQGIWLKDNVTRISLSNCVVTGTGQHALYAFNVDGVTLGTGNYWRTGNVSEADINFYADARNVRVHESNDFRRRSSLFDPAALATMRWF